MNHKPISKRAEAARKAGTDIDAHPAEIPPGIAKLLAEGMQNFETTVRAGGWQATIWKD